MGAGAAGPATAALVGVAAAGSVTAAAPAHAILHFNSLQFNGISEGTLDTFWWLGSGLLKRAVALRFGVRKASFQKGRYIVLGAGAAGPATAALAGVATAAGPVTAAAVAAVAAAGPDQQQHQEQQQQQQQVLQHMCILLLLQFNRISEGTLDTFWWLGSGLLKRAVALRFGVRKAGFQKGR